MTFIEPRATGRDVAQRPAHRSHISRRLDGFPSKVAQPVRALASQHHRLADLAVSFPALLFALAVPRPDFRPDHAIQRIVEGASLANVAGVAGLPLWLRKLPPEAFVRALPGNLPDGHTFRCRIANHLPRSPKSAAGWLQTVCDAARWSDENVAVWIARELTRPGKRLEPEQFRLICLWAWYSTNVPTDSFTTGLATPWTPAMQFEAARVAAEEWRQTLELALYLRSRPVTNTWHVAAEIDGYEFIPLDTADAITQEAQRMRNCLRSYGYGVAGNRCRIWSMRKDGQSVATIEVGRVQRSPLLGVLQVRGPGNARVGDEVLQAVATWFHRRPPQLLSEPLLGWRNTQIERRQWVDMWRPYWLAKRRLPEWLPLTPSRATIDQI